jgi:salicylate hydroxylase
MAYSYEGEFRPEDQFWAEHPIEYYQLDMERFVPEYDFRSYVFRYIFNDFRRLRKILGLVETVSARVTLSKATPEDLVCDSSKIVLVGDAAHPFLVINIAPYPFLVALINPRPTQPGGTHRAAFIFEDAETLRCLFSRIRGRHQISDFLTAYEEIRQPRCASALEYDRGFHSMVRMPPGPERDARDALLRQSMIHGDWDHMDEAAFRTIWGEELAMYAHDATEHVDDWWMRWGTLISRKGIKDEESGPTTTPMIPGLHRVSISSTTSPGDTIHESPEAKPSISL